MQNQKATLLFVRARNTWLDALPFPICIVAMTRVNPTFDILQDMPRPKSRKTRSTVNPAEFAVCGIRSKSLQKCNPPTQSLQENAIRQHKTKRPLCVRNPSKNAIRQHNHSKKTQSAYTKRKELFAFEIPPKKQSAY
jgi:hypothetical protein